MFLALLILGGGGAVVALVRGGLARAAAITASVGLVGCAVWLAIEVAWHPFADRTDPTVYAVWTVVVLAVVAAAVGPRRVLAAVSVVLTILGASGWTNCIFQQYPTLRSLNPVPAAKRMSYAEFQHTTLPPQIDGRDAGALVSVTIPAQSDYTPREAFAYIPPAYWRAPFERLPVLILMAGNPGSPEQWFTNGDAERTADDFQAAHAGRAPIIVSVDGTGSLTANPGCTGSSMQYLAETAPETIARLFRSDEDRSHWTIGGLSYGGTCSLQVVTNHPGSFGAFLNFSGQAEPTLGTRRQTVDQLFGGDEAKFIAENPADILARRRFDGVAGKFIAGSADEESVAALKHLNQLARAAGMQTDYSEVPGGHSFEVWRAALRQTFGFAAQRGGIS